MFEELFCEIFGTPNSGVAQGEHIGHSREGRPLVAYRFGCGAQRISLIAGCHADEPVGPLLLRKLSEFLSTADQESPLLKQYEWWIVPHLNPDGEAKNEKWYQDNDQCFVLSKYLKHAERELPGDDVEFNFPRDESDSRARPENLSVYKWWKRGPGSFSLHVSLHGMAFGAGPWFLIEPAWKERSALLKRKVSEAVSELGYVLHDVERNGEKGFNRLGRGFCTRPDSREMRKYFLELNDPETAQKFRPSSMECVRSMGGNPLTLVTELPLFILPGVGKTLGPPDPVMLEFKQTIERWKEELAAGRKEAQIDAGAEQLGIRPMPLRDQMRLQWLFICAGIEQTRKE